MPKLIEMNSNVPIKAVNWKKVEPEDALGALKTLAGLPRSGRTFSYRGEGVDTYLKWAAEELDGAVVDGHGKRRWTNALSHAKRAIDCVFDAYLEREYLCEALHPRANFDAKSALLARRFGSSWPKGLIDSLIAWPRNSSEHDFFAPDLQTATNAVETATVVVEALRARVEPLRGIALIGGFSASIGTSAERIRVDFNGYSEAFAVCWTAPSEHGFGFAPWVGVGRADAGVEVDWCWLREFGSDKHLELIEIWDPKETSLWQGESGLGALLNGIDLEVPLRS